MCRWSNRGLTRSIAASLPTLVAVVLILMIFVGFLSGSILFTYKVGMEAKDAIVTLKTHVDHSNYAETMGLNKWVEENNVTQQIDSYMSQAYEALLQQVIIPFGCIFNCNCCLFFSPSSSNSDPSSGVLWFDV